MSRVYIRNGRRTTSVRTSTYTLWRMVAMSPIAFVAVAPYAVRPVALGAVLGVVTDLILIAGLIWRKYGRGRRS